MKASLSGKRLLKALIKEYLMNEVDIEEVGDMCYTSGSTHDMQTCKIGGNKYYLKFSSEEGGAFDEVTDPSLQVLIEYLAYRVYGLYKDVKIPEDIQLVYDKDQKRVGIATTPAKGKQALMMRDLDHKKLAKSLSTGVYVDVLLANYDVVGTGSGNVFHDPESGVSTRIDPGSSAEFRARGGRKDFSPDAPELKSMLSTEVVPHGVGRIYQHADLKEAAKTFLSVPLSSILSTIDDVDWEISDQLDQKGLTSLLSQWEKDVNHIKSVISSRHKKISDHADFVLNPP